MKIKVIRNFNDKENDLLFREAGEVIEVNDKRGQELITKGFAEKIEEEPADKKKKN